MTDFLDPKKYIIQIWTTTKDEDLANIVKSGFKTIFSTYDTLYLDYQKVFDRCDQGVAAFALRRFGFQGDLGKWLYDFMRQRVQWVVVNNRSSTGVRVRTINLSFNYRKH